MPYKYVQVADTATYVHHTGGTTLPQAAPDLHRGEKVFFKIDYYDNKLELGSEDPADDSVTTRVMTVMFAHEY